MLSFWLAYILTRPLGANIGDFLASARGDGGLGLGTLVTSVVFLGTILATVVYLTVTRVDRTEDGGPAVTAASEPAVDAVGVTQELRGGARRRRRLGPGRGR